MVVQENLNCTCTSLPLEWERSWTQGEWGDRALWDSCSLLNMESGLGLKFKVFYQDCFWGKQTHCSGSIDPQSAPETGTEIWWVFLQMHIACTPTNIHLSRLYVLKVRRCRGAGPTRSNHPEKSCLKVPGGEKLPEASNTKLVKCLLKKCVLQEKPVTFKVLGNGRRRNS